jgi:hypothetical protein
MIMHNSPPLKEQILAEIQNGSVSMTPRIYFVVQLAMIVLVSTLISITTIFIASFLFFSIRISERTEFLSFGTEGIVQFFSFFPWSLLAIDVALIVSLQWLIRKFKLGYRFPFINALLVLLLFSGILGYLLDARTPLHSYLDIHRHSLPQPMNGFYENARGAFPKHSGVCRCTILSVSGNSITAFDSENREDIRTILVPEHSRRATTTNLAVGDTIFVAGHMMGDGVIHAFGINSKPLRQHQLNRDDMRAPR